MNKKSILLGMTFVLCIILCIGNKYLAALEPIVAQDAHKGYEQKGCDNPTSYFQQRLCHFATALKAWWYNNTVREPAATPKPAEPVAVTSQQKLLPATRDELNALINSTNWITSNAETINFKADKFDFNRIFKVNRKYLEEGTIKGVRLYNFKLEDAQNGPFDIPLTLAKEKGYIFIAYLGSDEIDPATTLSPQEKTGLLIIPFTPKTAIDIKNMFTSSGLTSSERDIFIIEPYTNKQEDIQIILRMKGGKITKKIYYDRQSQSRERVEEDKQIYRSLK